MTEHDQPYHAAEPEEAVRRLGTDRDRGLSGAEAGTRRERFGPNRLREAQRRHAGLILLDQFKSIVILLLVGAAGAAAVTARWPEAAALVAVTAINTLIGFVSEWKALRSMEALRDLGERTVRVVRDGEERDLDARELVPGDLVRLEAEALVAADLRLLDAEALSVNEAALTGESVPVLKSPAPVAADAPLAERTGVLYKGTTVTEGRAEAVVFATGMDTELGRISELAQSAQDQSTPLQERLDRLGRRLAWITLGVAVVVAGTGLAVGRDALIMIETAIALGIAAIPEGLPIVATIALARGMVLMARRNAVVNRLTSVETLGATRIILADKTGTLTENRMTVRRVVTAAGEHELARDRPEAGRAGSGGDRPEEEAPAEEDLLRRAVRAGVLCNNAVRNGEESRGDPMEVALLEAGAGFGLDRGELLGEMPEEREEPFDPGTMMMATFHRDADGVLVAVKGAPQAVLEASTTVADGHGGRELGDEDRRRWIERADAMAGEGLRLLAVAERRADSADEDPYGGLRFLGLVGLVDPPREDVRDAVEECRRAGMRAVMVTGDRPDTGLAVAERVGLAPDGSAIHGRELSDLGRLPAEERKRVLEASVFARVTPEQKLNLVELYQSEGEIVAMTGDGINDAPALRQADIGVAMGRRGTDAAKQVADMVLLDDEFATIVAAVRQGRIIFSNLRKSVMFMLCTNLAEILAVTLASLAQAPIPLKPLQILFLNVLTDVFPALALGIGAGSGDVMDRPPRDPGEPVLTRTHWLAIGAWSAVIGAGVLGALALALSGFGFSEERAVTVSFLTLAFSKLWFVLNLRDRGARVWDNDVVRNPWIWGATALCTGLLLAAVYWPPLAGVLRTEDPGSRGWLLILGMSLVPALVGVFAPGIRFYGSSARPAGKGARP